MGIFLLVKGRFIVFPIRELYLLSSGFIAIAVSPNIVSGLVVAIVINSLFSKGYFKNHKEPCFSSAITSRSESAV